MTLAAMVAAGEDDLTCDLAETYGVLNWRALPLPLAATLAAGLRSESRIRMRMAGDAVPADTLLLAAAVDRLSTLAWMLSRDGQKGRSRPFWPSLVAALLGTAPSPRESGIRAFDTPDQFRAAWAAAAAAERRENGRSHSACQGVHPADPVRRRHQGQDR